MPRMAKRIHARAWAKTFERSFVAITHETLRAGNRAVGRAVKPTVDKRRPPPGAGDWIPGMAMGPTGVRRFRLYRPPDIGFGERLPLMVMLHGCGQDAKSFATSTRMNRIAERERFLVLYPEQGRLANPQGCWNWFDTTSGRAYGEAALIIKAIDQVCLLYPVDRARIAVGDQPHRLLESDLKRQSESPFPSTPRRRWPHFLRFRPDAAPVRRRRRSGKRPRRQQ